MATATITKSVVIDGHGGSMVRNGTTYTTMTRLAGSGVTLNPAYAGSLTTRTDANTGVVTTTNTPTGIATNDIVDVYWSGGRRRQMVATVSGSAITVDGGSGDDLPALSTAVVICEALAVTFPTVTMSGVNAIVAKVTGTIEACQVSVGVTSGSYTEGDYLLLNNPTTTGHVFGDTFCWDDLFSEANELASASTFNTLYISHADTVNTPTFTFDVAV